ncbi:hypothetical protein [Hymenobacter sp. APR13]|uniref:hypothetical protein n=1 Tax=Hymenobacter sp. APR13 TaxID=1356852 RepID=UPI0004E07AB9|nr:hypothetical protein [Hymenobacter sp. APR13]AII53864.1 hypothetical protein N008_18005 [Hymenobacter sp. APR13]
MCRFFSLLLGWALLLPGRATAQVLPPDTLAVLVPEPRLGLQLLVPASFVVEPRRGGPPDPNLSARLTQLLGSRAAATASVVLELTQRTAPRSTLTVVHIPAPTATAWLSWGFEAWRPGRFYRGSTSPPLTQELACALPGGGWLYLRAQVPASAYGPNLATFPTLARTLHILYGSRIFPALRLAGLAAPTTASQLARYADSLAHHTPGGNPLPALGAVREARHAAGASFSTPAEVAANAALDPYLPLRSPRVMADLWYMGDAFDKLESWTHAPAQRWLYTESALDFLALPAPEYGTDGVIDCTAGAVHSTRNALSELLARARGKRVVLVNENVYRPHHRTLLALALPGLYAQGFRYLAIRSLTAGAPPDLPYPTLADHEFAPDYQFANLVRSARRLGFTLIGYADTTFPAGFRQNWPQGISAALDQARWTEQYRFVSPLRPALDALPAGAKVVVLAPGLEPRREPTVAEGPAPVPLLAGWGGRSVLVVEQLQVAADRCLDFAALQLPQPSVRLDSLPRPDVARVVYVQYPSLDRPGLTPPRPLTPTADLSIYNRLDAARLPLPYPYATTARPVRLALPAATGPGRRVLQLYLAAELVGPAPGQVPPVFTQEIGPAARSLPLLLCPGRYRYVLRTADPAADTWTELHVGP